MRRSQAMTPVGRASAGRAGRVAAGPAGLGVSDGRPACADFSSAFFSLAPDSFFLPQPATHSARETQITNRLDVRSMIGTFFWIKMVIVAAFLVAMVFVKRPFCRTFCPLGAIFSLFNRISLVKLRLDKSKCTECGLCRRLCPVDLNAYLELDSPECIKCLECTKCPTGAITARFGLGVKP